MNRQISMLRYAIASLGFIAAIASQPTAASAQDLPALPKAIKDAGVIRIGVKCDSPPFGSSGPDGKPVGVEVEMAKKIGTYAFGSPDKAPQLRLETIAAAADARVPFTTGILIGIGETRAERLHALRAIRDLAERHDHVQEVIVQNFRAKPGTRMADAAAAGRMRIVRWPI